MRQDKRSFLRTTIGTVMSAFADLDLSLGLLGLLRYFASDDVK